MRGRGWAVKMDGYFRSGGRSGRLFPLAIRTERPLKEQDVSGEWMAARFHVQRLLFVGSE
jgi:hypothetical protein